MPNTIFTIYGLYLSFVDVRKCTEALRLAEIRSADICVLLCDGSVVSTAAGSLDLRGRDSETYRAAEPKLGSCHNHESADSVSLIRNLLSLGVPVYDSERFAERIRNGGILLMVRCSDASVDDVKATLIETGAQAMSLSQRRGHRLFAPREKHHHTGTAVELRRAAAA